jgi:hypothetical protein
MHAIRQATKVKSLLYYSVQSVCSVASYDKGTDKTGMSGKWTKDTQVIWGEWVVGAQRKVERVQRVWGGMCRREVGGLGVQKGVLCWQHTLISMKVPTCRRHCFIMVLWGSAEKADSLWVLDFVMSLPGRFCFFEHLLECQHPTISYTYLIMLVFA